MTEQEILQSLIDRGYKVEVINPFAEKFNEKYAAYQDFSIGKRYAVLDENGKIIGQQG